MEELLYLLGLLILYLLPGIAAILAKKKRASGIFILNLFLGWTLIGWVAALIWASCEPIRGD
jgi:hypothetical protein